MGKRAVNSGEHTRPACSLRRPRRNSLLYPILPKVRRREDATTNTRAACAPQSLIRVIRGESPVPVLLLRFESSKRLGDEFA